MKQNNEFLRKRPAERNRKVLFDLSNLILPVLVVVIGLIVSTQTYAKLVGYNPKYTDAPFFVTTGKFLFIDEGYPFYNPGLIFLTVMSKGLTDNLIQSVRYSVEEMTGMPVKAINIFVEGVRVID